MYIRTTILLLTTILLGCASIPREAPELSLTLGQRITAIRDANVTLLHRYFDLKRSEVDRFIQELWVPRFAKNVFTNPDVEREWLVIVASDDTQRRLEFILNAASALQGEINRKRNDLIRPLDEFERHIKQTLEDEYDEALSINNTITSFLTSASEVATNRNRYLEMLGVKDKRVAEAIEGVDRAVTGMLGNVNNLEAGTSDFVTKMREIEALFSGNKRSETTNATGLEKDH